MSLRVERLRFAYAGRPLLDRLDVEVAAGRILAVLGPSGVGKTTLLRCIAGLERPDAGRVLLAGADLTDRPVHERRIGLLFQEPTLFPHLRAWQNVAFGLRYGGVPRAERRATANDWLARVRLAGRADARSDELSGGERQRVALARTLAVRPRAVLLDEPLSALDRDLRVVLGADIKALLHAEGVPAIWVTHDAEEAQRVGDEARSLQDGRLGDAAPRAGGRGTGPKDH